MNFYRIIQYLIAITIILYGIVTASLADRDGIEGSPDNASIVKAAICIIIGIGYFATHIIVIKMATKNKKLGIFIKEWSPKKAINPKSETINRKLSIFNDFVHLLGKKK